MRRTFIKLVEDCQRDWIDVWISLRYRGEETSRYRSGRSRYLIKYTAVSLAVSHECVRESRSAPRPQITVSVGILRPAPCHRPRYQHLDAPYLKRITGEAASSGSSILGAQLFALRSRSPISFEFQLIAATAVRHDS